MTERLTPEQAAALLRPTDVLGIPLGPGHPGGFLHALGGRDDWEDLLITGALLTDFYEVFGRPGVRFLSGFFGPLERLMRDQGGAIEFVPADFRRFAPALERIDPRVMATAASPPDADGWCSLSLHAGATIGRDRAGRRRPRPAPGRRGQPRVPPHARPRRAPPPHPRRPRSTCSSRPTASRS